LANSWIIFAKFFYFDLFFIAVCPCFMCFAQNLHACQVKEAWRKGSNLNCICKCCRRCQHFLFQSSVVVARKKEKKSEKMRQKNRMAKSTIAVKVSSNWPIAASQKRVRRLSLSFAGPRTATSIGTSKPKPGGLNRLRRGCRTTFQYSKPPTCRLQLVLHTNRYTHRSHAKSCGSDRSTERT